MSTPSDQPASMLLPRCPSCGRPLLAAADRCPSCHSPLNAPSVATSLLSRPPLQWPLARHGMTRLLPNYRVIFQLLPSGVCLPLPPGEKSVMGRGPALPSEHLIDLAGYNGYQRGVSRRHCVLIRQDEHLYLVDLGSSNGTSLNGEPLKPQRRYSVADGDKLILGSLHLSVSFFPPDGSGDSVE